MKRIVLLDFGGTLDGDGLHWSVQYAQAFAAANVQVMAEPLREAFLASDQLLLSEPGIETLGLDRHVRLQVEKMLAHLGLACDDRAQRIAEHWLAKSRVCLAQARKAMLQHRSHLRYGMVSNFTCNLPVILAQEGLADLFDCVMVSEAVKARKPEPEIFRLALAHMAESADGAAMVGDSLPSDIRGAKAVGLTTVWVRGEPAASHAKPAEADYAVRDVSEALDLLAAAA